MREQPKEHLVELATFAERPESVSFIGSLQPPSNEIAAQDPITRYVRRMHGEAPEYQLLIQDVKTRQVVGFGLAMPFSWDLHPETLPTSVSDLIESGLSFGERHNALGGVYAWVHPRYRSEGASSFLIRGMRELHTYPSAGGAIVRRVRSAARE